ncbi:hypothetical protein D3C71_2096470 [compost metagenome]
MPELQLAGQPHSEREGDGQQPDGRQEGHEAYAVQPVGQRRAQQADQQLRNAGAEYKRAYGQLGAGQLIDEPFHSQ